MHDFLAVCQEAYFRGEPLISDQEFDYLAKEYEFSKLGYTPKVKDSHGHKMFSLQKVYEDEPLPSYNTPTITTPKLDGAAIALYYSEDGRLVKALTRGDGKEGEVILEKILLNHKKLNIPISIPNSGNVQITGEIVAEKTIPNARNYAAGSLNLKDSKEFGTRLLKFIAYGINPSIQETYKAELDLLSIFGFTTVNDYGLDIYPTDGSVVRINSNAIYRKMGFTSQYPKGAYALKSRLQVGIVKTKLRNIEWNVGTNGKVTPVAVFDEIRIEAAKITRATLHNAGFVEQYDLHEEDTILVTRAGGIIPKVVGKA